jgi:hypothetical protein
MKIKTDSIILLALTYSISLLFLTSHVSAFAIGGLGNANTFKGSNVEAGFSIMNRGVNDDDKIVEVIVEEGSEYVSIIGDNTFNVPAGKIAGGKALISIPNTTGIGDKFNSTILFKTVSGGVHGDPIGIRLSYRKSFEIHVIQRHLPDYDNDGDIDKTDYNTFSQCLSECARADVNADNIVNILDQSFVKSKLFCSSDNDLNCAKADSNSDKILNLQDISFVRSNLFCRDVSKPAADFLCQASDFDANRIINTLDKNIFESCFSGKDRPISKTCVNQFT